MLAKKKTTRLVSGFTIDDVAEACRSAALEFVEGVREGWGKKELATWLTGAYHQTSLLRCSADELAFSDVLDHTPKPPPVAGGRRSVPPEDLVKTMKAARDEVLAVLQRFASADDTAETFVWRVKSKGALARVEDDDGRVGLVPNEIPSQRLADRVLSLFAADYVARPLDYEDRIAVCTACCSVSFEPGARTSCKCGAQRTMSSGVRPRVEWSEVDLKDGDLTPSQAEALRKELGENTGG